MGLDMDGCHAGGEKGLILGLSYYFEGKVNKNILRPAYGLWEGAGYQE